MANTINQGTQNSDMSQIEEAARAVGVDLTRMNDPQYRAQAIQELEASMKQTQQKDLGGTIGRGLGSTSDIFLQAGGITPQKQAGGGINDFMQREQFKQELGRPAAEKKAEEALAKTGREEEKVSIARSKEKREQLKFDREETERVVKAEASSRLVQDTTDELLDSVAEAKKGIKYFGPPGILPAIPGLEPEKVKWQANIEKLLAKKILALMTEMKSASRTGATGFGQLSEKELKVLQDGSTALRKFMSEEDALKILNNMEQKLLKIKGGQQGGQQGLPTQAQGQQEDPLGIR